MGVGICVGCGVGVFGAVGLGVGGAGGVVGIGAGVGVDVGEAHVLEGVRPGPEDGLGETAGAGDSPADGGAFTVLTGVLRGSGVDAGAGLALVATALGVGLACGGRSVVAAGLSPQPTHPITRANNTVIAAVFVGDMVGAAGQPFAGERTFLVLVLTEPMGVI